jgi:FkbM family methyltransferase
MIHPNPFISAFLSVPEWSWKNDLRRWLGFSRFVPNFIQDFSPLKGYERVEQLREGDVVVDAGAYPGDYTLFAARQVGSSGRVLALEPDPDNRSVLERIIRKSGFTNIEVIPLGLWDSVTSLSLDAAGVASTLSSSISENKIPVTSLDDLLNDLDLEKIDVLKMDIEGAELPALRGATKTLRSCRYVCVASYHVVEGEPTAERVEKILQETGFEVETGYPKHLTTTGIRRS